VQIDLVSSAGTNSLFVPQLGGRIFTMAGILTRLNLQAVRPDTYRARSASYSGAGFADMHLNLDHSDLVYDLDAAARPRWR